MAPVGAVDSPGQAAVSVTLMHFPVPAAWCCRRWHVEVAPTSGCWCHMFGRLLKPVHVHASVNTEWQLSRQQTVLCAVRSTFEDVGGTPPSTRQTS